MTDGKTMTNAQMTEFIKSIGRAELYDELNLMRTQERPFNMTQGLFYLKGVCVTLVELGYDGDWVYGTFRAAFEEYYKKGK